MCSESTAGGAEWSETSSLTDFHKVVLDTYKLCSLTSSYDKEINLKLKHFADANYRDDR
jgi:hypothetical protein